MVKWVIIYQGWTSIYINWGYYWNFYCYILMTCLEEKVDVFILHLNNCWSYINQVLESVARGRSWLSFSHLAVAAVRLGYTNTCYTNTVIISTNSIILCCNRCPFITLVKTFNIFPVINALILLFVHRLHICFLCKTLKILLLYF